MFMAMANMGGTFSCIIYNIILQCIIIYTNNNSYKKILYYEFRKGKLPSTACINK